MTDFDCTKPHQTTIYLLESMMVRAVLKNLECNNESRLVPYVNQSPEIEMSNYEYAAKIGKIVVKP